MFRFSRKLLQTLVVVEGADGKVSAPSLSAITGASKIGEPVTVLVAGHGIGKVAEHAATITGVSKVLKVDSPNYVQLMPENTAALLVDLRKKHGFKRVVGPHTAACKALIPRAAALEGRPATSDVMKASGSDVTRPMYAGNVIASGSVKGDIQYLTIRSTSFDKAATGGSAPIEEVAAGADLGLSKFVKVDVPVSDKADLGTARCVVSGGRGLKAGENFKLLHDLAAKLPNCAVGATRAVVDAGMCSYDMQVGQTGKIVAPDLYIAVGLSGAIQHLAGMKDSKVIVAINNDPEAPIFSVADYALQEDLFKAVPALTAAV